MLIKILLSILIYLLIRSFFESREVKKNKNKNDDLDGYELLIELLQNLNERLVAIEKNVYRDYPTMKNDVRVMKIKLKKLEEIKREEEVKNVKNDKKEIS